MSRAKRAPGEKQLLWIASAWEDLMDFPDEVRDEIGFALGAAQFGGKHPKAKPWKGVGPGVFEIVEDFRGDAYRTVYTIKFAKAVYVLHAFQKKSTTGIKTSSNDVELAARRLKLAQEDYEAHHGEQQP